MSNIFFTVIPNFARGDVVLRTDADADTPGILPEWVGYVVEPNDPDNRFMTVSEVPPEHHGPTHRVEAKGFTILCAANRKNKTRGRRV